MAVRVVIAEDHAVVREGLRMFLRGDGAGIEVVGEATDGREAVELARQLRPDVVLMDLVMPVMDGISAIAAIRQDLPEVEVVALTGFIEDHLVTGALRAGAIGYLVKDADADSVRRAVWAAAAGQVFLSPDAAARLVREVRVPRNVTDLLTRREIEVLILVARGRSNKEIARELAIGQQTVKTYISTIFRKLSVQSRTQAALYALQNGLVSRYELAQ
ncbi:MAG: response regulator transcription factor [Micromonosporaceae bacterium]|jgi:NarL family two-component system response regulator LiaR